MPIRPLAVSPIGLLAALASSSLLVSPYLLAPSTLHAESLPTGFQLEAAAPGPFTGEPTAFTFLPDGRILIMERDTGNVLVVPFLETAGTLVFTVPDLGMGFGERGALGIAVDPAWPNRPFVYIYYTHTSGYAYVTMHSVAGELSDPTSTILWFESSFHLITDAPDDVPVHHGGTLRFGIDGMLYLTLGDNVSPCSSQSLSLMHGKLLRIDVAAMPEAGGGPPLKVRIAPLDNPFSGPDEVQQLVYAYGLRNPFRFTVDPLTGDLFIADVGENEFEEVNRIPFAEGGQNFGWPAREAYAEHTPPPGCEELHDQWDDPIYAYAHEAPSSNAIIGGPLYRNDPFSPFAFPPEYDGHYFFSDHVKGFVRRLEEGPGGWSEAEPVVGQPSPENWAEGIYYITDFQQGPDGALYLMKRYAPGSGPGSQHPRGLYRIAHNLLPTGVDVRPGAASRARFAPNPARAGEETIVRWSAPMQAPVDVRIYDAAGRLVQSIETREAAGLRWDTRSRRGATVPGGTYFVRARDAAGHEITGRVTVLR